MRICILLLATMGLLVAIDHPLGEQGVVLHLPEGWQHFNDEASRFVNDTGDVHLVAKVYERSVAGRAGATSVLQQLLDEAELAPPDNEEDLQVVAAHGHWRGSYRLNTVKGGPLRQAVAFLAKDDLCITCFFSAPRAKAHVVDRLVDSLPQLVSLPAADSAWQDLRQPIVHATELGSNDLSLSVPPSRLILVEKKDRGDAFWGFKDKHGQFAAWFLDGGRQQGLDRALDSSLGYIVADPALVTDGVRDDATVAGHPARRLVFSDPDDGNDWTYEVYAIRLAEDRVLDLRLVLAEPKSAWIHLRDEVLANLVIEDQSSPHALAAPMPVLLDPLMDAEPVLSGLGATAGRGGVSIDSHIIQVLTPDLALTNDRLLRLEPAGATVVRHLPEGPRGPRLARIGKLLLHLDDDGGITDLISGERSVLTRVAALADGGQDHGYAVIRDPEPEPVMHGWPSRSAPPPLRLVTVAADGAIGKILPWEANAWSIHDLAVSSKQVCAVACYRWRDPWTDTDPSGLRIDLVRAGAEPIPCPTTWSSIRLLVAQDDAFLVSGAPLGGMDGVHLLKEDGSLTPLFATTRGYGLRWHEQTGLDLLDCFYHGRWHYRWLLLTPAQVAQAPAPMLPDATAVLARDWITTQPSLADLRRSEAATWRAAAAAARARAASLPTSPAGIDALLRSSPIDTLTAEQMVLYEVLLVDALLERGGRLVPMAAQPDLSARHPLNHVHAYAVRPDSLLLEAIHDSEGTWAPVGSTIQAAQGRTILLGFDASSLVAAMKAANDAPLTASVLAATPEACTTLAASSNRHLRELAYDRWFAADKPALVLALAAPLAARDDAAAEDRHAYLLAQSMLAGEGTDWETLAAGFRELIVRHPERGGACLDLARIYERLDGPRSRRARACYSRVIDEWSSGAWVKQAKDALQRRTEAETPASTEATELVP